MFHPKCISAALFYSVISSNNLFPPPQKKTKKPAVSTCWQSLWASRIFAFLSCHSVLHGAPIGFQGKKTLHRALCVQEIWRLTLLTD